MNKISGIVNTKNAQAPISQNIHANTSNNGTDISQSDAELNLETKTFADFGLSSEIVEALSEKGITTPFPIQALTLPIALKRADIIGQAKTGTGKTLGFGLPLLENVIGPNEEGWEEFTDKGFPQALVIVPTRELAKQVAGDLRDAAAKRSLRIIELYGGIAYEPQIAELKSGAEIIVGTPGRLIDLKKQRNLNLSHAKTVVLDEADEMLDLGFLEDVETLLAATPATRHTMLFSATMPGPVIAMARRYMSRPTHIRAQEPNDDTTTVQTVKQVIYRCHSLNKAEVIARILQAKNRDLAIVFTRTKRSAAQLVDELKSRGFAAGAMHGDLGQGAREQALRAFRNGKIDVLVATDVAARGIDVDNVTHVINYQCPEDEKTYLHRIGRTGRAGNSGTAVTFVDWEDTPKWSVINNQLGLNFPEPVETYHTSEHLYADLEISPEVTGKLPREQRTRAGLSAEKLEDLGETGKRRPRRRKTSKSSQNSHTSKKNPQSTGAQAGKHTGFQAGKGTEKQQVARAEKESGEKRRPRQRRRIKTID